MLYLKQCENNECLIGKENSAILKKQRNVTLLDWSLYHGWLQVFSNSLLQ